MKPTLSPIVRLYIMNAFGKGFSIFYFVLLPVFYAQKIIDSTQLGYIGAIMIAMLIFGAITVVRWLHNIETKTLLQAAALSGIASSFFLLFALNQKSLGLLTAAYAIMGLVVGIAMSGVKAVAAEITARGDRYKSLAKLHMTTDIVRIGFPLLVSGAIVLGSTSAAVFLIIIAGILFFILTSSLPRITQKISVPSISGGSLSHNKDFFFMQAVEFLDSFSSSQLFVFLPLIFLSKGYSLQSSLLLQTFIFLGYISGRYFVSVLAKRFSGLQAIAYAEIGMVLSIILLLLTSNFLLLYVITYFLGIFARGTSPAIEALSMDTLTESQTKKGTALHIVFGDSGSALSQLIFGLLIAWYGVNSPFIISAVIAGLVGVLCLSKKITV